MKSYSEFIDTKQQLSGNHGFDLVFSPDAAFDFQTALLEWAVRKGRAAIFADCGLGKTLIQLAWAENIVRKTNKRVLILTPLAVGAQTVREGEKFGIECRRSFFGGDLHMISVTNYERLHHFDWKDFGGCVCDESSILKSFDGVRRNQITEFMRKLPYRLLCTATAAPNDYIELGTSSEALGYLGHMDMLNRFFKNDLNNSAQGRYCGKEIKWRFKGHAEQPFWRWVCSWARAVRKPSDFGFDDGKFVLPELIEREHLIETSAARDGMLFAVPAMNMREQREEQKLTLKERCEKAAELASDGQSVLVWCHLNSEGDLLEKLIRNSVQVSGDDPDEAKEEKFLAFASGEIKPLITKHKIGAWGLNFQHCAHQTSFPSHSFEQYYQGIRRSWRFGQDKQVVSDIITTEGERGVLDNLQRKQHQADRMFSNLIAKMNEQLQLEQKHDFSTHVEVPSWVA